MRPYSIFWRYVSGQRRWFALVLLCSAAAAVLGPLQPLPLKWLVDNVLQHKALTPPLAEWLQALSIPITTVTLAILAALATVILFLLNSTADAASAWGWVIGGRSMVYAVTDDLFAALQRRSLAYHARHGAGDALSRVTGDSWAVYQQLDALMISPTKAILTMVVMLLIMARLDLVLTGAALAITPLVLGASALIGDPIRTASRLRRDIEARLQAHLQQTLTGVPVVQVFMQQNRENRRFEVYADAAIAAEKRGVLLGSVNSLAGGLVAAVGTGLVFWVGGQHVLAGRLSLGSLLAFVFWFQLWQTQAGALAKMFSTWQLVRASFDRMRDTLHEPEIRESSDARPIPALRGHVRFANVTAGYEMGRAVLQEVSFEAKPGELLAIVGPSGSGKSTLLGLVPRLLDPSSGQVFLDGHDVAGVQLKSLRQQIALVSQEPFLFPWSVAENIAYGRPGASRSEVENAAKAANAHKFIQGLPNGYETLIGERGGTLSGGERQRIAIARAVLKQAPILLLDEPTSALDPATEHLVLEALDRLMTGRTTLMVAHRLSTIRRAHRILMLVSGRIIELGTHEELLARRGTYATWSEQLK